jgi:uncharacterized protein YbcV (DUF1398 family)
MNNLAASAREVVNVRDLAETDIFQMLMRRDRVRKSDFLQLCDETSREIGQYRGSSAA